MTAIARPSTLDAVAALLARTGAVTLKEWARQRAVDHRSAARELAALIDAGLATWFRTAQTRTLRYVVTPRVPVKP